MRSLVSSLAMLALLTSAPASVAAQPGPVSSPVQIEFTPVAGVLVPLSDLVEASGTTGGDEIRLSETPAYGAGAGVLLPGGLGLELQALLAPGAEIRDGDGATADAYFRALTGNLIYRFSPPGIDLLVEPFLGIGGGMRNFSLDDAEPVAPEEPAPGEADDFVASVSAGTYLNLGGLRLRAEIRDYISSFRPEGSTESNLQNDLAALLGVAFRIP